MTKYRIFFSRDQKRISFTFNDPHKAMEFMDVACNHLSSDAFQVSITMESLIYPHLDGEEVEIDDE